MKLFNECDTCTSGLKHNACYLCQHYDGGRAAEQERREWEERNGELRIEN